VDQTEVPTRKAAGSRRDGRVKAERVCPTMIGNQANALLGIGSCAPDRASRSGAAVGCARLDNIPRIGYSAACFWRGKTRGEAGSENQTKGGKSFANNGPVLADGRFGPASRRVATRLRHARVVSTRLRPGRRDRLCASAGGVGPLTCFVAEHRQEGSGLVQRRPAQVARTDLAGNVDPHPEARIDGAVRPS
jgi:hypothetical protein